MRARLNNRVKTLLETARYTHTRARARKYDDNIIRARIARQLLEDSTNCKFRGERARARVSRGS